MNWTYTQCPPKDLGSTLHDAFPQPVAETVGRFSSTLGFLVVLVKSLSLLYKETSLRHAPWPVLMRDFPGLQAALKDLEYL